MPRPTRSQYATGSEFQAAHDAWHEKIHNFANQVDARVEEQYDLQDGGDLCYNLIDAGAISEDASVDEAARIVAQHIMQA